MKHINSVGIVRLTSKQYEEREMISQGIRCTSDFIRLRNFAKQLNRLATELEQQKLFPNQEKINAKVL